MPKDSTPTIGRRFLLRAVGAVALTSATGQAADAKPAKKRPSKKPPLPAPEPHGPEAWLAARLEPDGSFTVIKDPAAKTPIANGESQTCHPASLAKLMTALLVIEKLHTDAALMDVARAQSATMPKNKRTAFMAKYQADQDIRFPDGGDTPVKISPYAASTPFTSSRLPSGSEIPAGDALKIMLAISANDLAVSLAEHIAGDEDSFVGMMNGRARQLNMMNTLYVTPNGQDNLRQQQYNLSTPGDQVRLMGQLATHLSSPQDMALLAPHTVSLKRPRSMLYANVFEETVLDRNLSTRPGAMLEPVIAKGGENWKGMDNILLLRDKQGALYVTVVLQADNEAALMARQTRLVEGLDRAVNGLQEPPKLFSIFHRHPGQ